MKKVLVLYYSQTGQLLEIVRSILAAVEKDPACSIVYEELKPEKPYRFPWTAYRFCDAFPEAAAGISCDMQPLSVDPNEDFDLVVLAYTVWYLSPAIPVWSFLQTPAAQQLIGNRPVLTVIGCRNMWLLAQEKVKQRLAVLGGKLTGNIVLTDRAGNLVGVLTIAVWMLTGRKERFLRVFPRPGVSEDDIRGAGRFGSLIHRALGSADVALDQVQLNSYGAVRVDPALLLMEKRVAKVFAVWSAFIRQKGGPGNPGRRRRVRLFMFYLIAAVIVLAPLATLAAALLKSINKKRLAAETDYYSQNALRPSGG
jgi:hypothetical protein